jgi:aspartyl-tRNA(Asn)/glutamyl-tRNA(Gln) amidotransferase subunit A
VPGDLHHLTIAEAAALIARRELSPVELTEACLHRVQALNGRLAAFVSVTAERARRAARAAEREVMAAGPRGALHGIPYCLKDVFDVAGVRTTAGSRLLADNVAARDSACAGRLEAAGAVLLGKTTTWEFAHGGPSWDVPFPPARNPWDTDRSPSGSSSGSAAAVAAGLAPASLGTDTGGSVRGPAAACGVAGLKPTYGRVSRRGVVPNCFSHDHAGPLAWTARDVALLLGAVAGHDPADPASADVAVPDHAAALTGRVEGLVVGVPWRWLEDDLPPAPETRAAFDAALSVFRAAGAEVREVSLPPLPDFHAAMKVIAVCELFAVHGPDLRTRPEMFGASLRYRVIAGGLVRAEDYLAATRARRAGARGAARACRGGGADAPHRRAARTAGAGAPGGHLHPAQLHRPVQRQRQPGAVDLQRLQRGGPALLAADRRPALRRGDGAARRRRLRGGDAVEVPQADAPRLSR